MADREQNLIVGFAKSSTDREAVTVIVRAQICVSTRSGYCRNKMKRSNSAPLIAYSEGRELPALGLQRRQDMSNSNMSLPADCGKLEVSSISPTKQVPTCTMAQCFVGVV